MCASCLRLRLAIDSKPRFHGNGFVQLALAANVRLHIWSPDLPAIPGHNATIHDHVWDLNSAVLLGTVGHRTWGRMLGGEMYNVYSVGEADKPGLGAMEGIGKYGVTGFYSLYEGSTYFFPKLQLHETIVTGKAATLMVKTPTNTKDRPHVLCPKGQKPTDAFATEFQPSQDKMWEAIHDALAAMGRTSHNLIANYLK